LEWLLWQWNSNLPAPDGTVSLPPMLLLMAVLPSPKACFVVIAIIDFSFIKAII
jgi:hypothetical protein